MKHGAMILVLLMAMAEWTGCCPHRRHHIAMPAAAQVPIPSPYLLNTQPVMQAVYHWELLASDLTQQIMARLTDEAADFSEAIYVTPFGAAPFEKAFRELLITKLVEQRFAVSHEPQSALTLAVDIQLVRHERDLLHTASGVYSALAPGVFVRRDLSLAGPGNDLAAVQADLFQAQLNVEAGLWSPRLPETEILITTSLSRNDRFLLRNSSIYYIPDRDWAHYRKVRTGVVQRKNDVTYSVVSE